ncbi:MAG: hypothetical protein P9M15_01740 [Candidatus Electryoneaceae bacterium]|nr:hypothetical protein [Candidatus Electryoneaceae bacterium]
MTEQDQECATRITIAWLESISQLGKPMSAGDVAEGYQIIADAVLSYVPPEHRKESDHQTPPSQNDKPS